MKTTSFSLAILLGTLLCTPSASQAWVYRVPAELQAEGDFDGNGLRDLVIVDRATGSYRIGYQLAPGVYTWAAARASGIPNVTGLAVGRVQSLAYDSVVFTAPEANRINLLDASNPGVPGLPAPLFLPNLGPNLVGAIDIGGVGNTLHDDLYVASIYNSNSPNHETLVRSTGSTLSVLADNAIVDLRDEANRVYLNTNEPARLGCFARGGSTDTFQVLDFAVGATSYILGFPVSTAGYVPECLLGQFATTNKLTQLLQYWVNSSYLYWYQIKEPSPGSFSYAFVNAKVFTNTVDQVFMLPATNGTKLLILFAGGSLAQVFTFDGVNAPVVVQEFVPDPGEHFTGAGVLGASGFMAYSAPLGQNTSSKFKTWNWNGSGYTAGASGDLPRLSTFSASGNVLQFQFEPFVTNQPILLRLNNAGDWSSQLKYSGSPSNVSVTTETFLTPTQGLANPMTTVLGKSHPLAKYGLANQFSNMISLYSFQPAVGDKISDVTIAPAPGSYTVAISLQFAAANPTDLIFFRFVPGGNWMQYTGQTVRVITNTLVQYYGQPGAGVLKSSIKSAQYSITVALAQLDSNHDGVPDYVAVARGLNPNGGKDSDGDGFTDLEELIHHTDPTNKLDFPTTNTWAPDKLHIDDQAVFDVLLRARPWDGYSNGPTLCATGAVLFAHDLQGGFLRSASLGSNAWPTARLSNVVVNPEARLVVLSTDPHYSLITTNPDNAVGREMVGLIQVPVLSALQVPYTFGSAGGNITNEAQGWIVAASNAWWNLKRAVLTNDLTVDDTLTALLVEQKIAQLLGARGTNWWTNVTLFPYRVNDLTRVNPSQDLLLSLENAAGPALPGYNLQTLFVTISNLVETSVLPGVTNLRWVVRDVYRIDSLLNNANPATFALPVDELRQFLWQGTLDSNYLYWASSASGFSNASAGAAFILNSVTSRPTTNLTLVVRSDTFTGSCRILDRSGGGVPWGLLNDAGLAFSFPANFNLLPGAVLTVSGYTDVTNTDCASRYLQVTNMMLTSVPVASDYDLNGNLLLDTWEQVFFGKLGVDPFADSDGDGYSNLQEMLDGTDPTDPLSHVGSAVAFAPPTLTLLPSGGTLHLIFNWPSSYISRFVIGLRSTAALGSPFMNEPSAVLHDLPAPDWHELTLATPADPGRFYYLYLMLAPIGP